MTIYHVEFAKTGNNLSGGEVCMLGIIEHYKDRGYKNVVLTTDNGKEAYIKGLPESKLVQYRTVSARKSEVRYGVFMSYVMRTFAAIRLINTLRLKPNDLIICHSEFFPNSISAWRLAKINPKARSANIFHMKAPRLLHGYEGEFTGHYQFPRLTILHYQLNQWLFRKLTLPKTIVFTVNPYYEKYLEAQYPKNNIIVLKHHGNGGVPIKNALPKEFDLVWVGRFHRQKGLKDLGLIIKSVSETMPNIKVAVIGDGPQEIKKLFLKQLNDLGIRPNVYLTGFLVGKEKSDYYLKSRVFVMTSYYESFGQVTLEAMRAGLPVVAYDLPVYGVFEDGIIRVPLLNYKDAAAQILNLLKNEELYKTIQKKAQYIASERSWAHSADDILGAFK